jgi:arginase family enzyme
MDDDPFGELLRQATAADFASQPRPGWAGIATLFGAPAVALPPPAGVAFLAAGVPFDATASSRPGAAEGPAAIRSASRIFSAYIDSLGEHEMVDTRTGRAFRYRTPRLADAGDFHVYPTDLRRTFQAVATEARELASTGAVTLFLGGDHSVSFPLFAGVAAARPERGRLGYVQIDHHFDFGTYSALHGALYHGSNARRISEIPGIEPSQIAFVGVGSVTRRDQLDDLHRRGFHIVTAAAIRKVGAASALREVIGSLSAQCDAVYLSCDIDVLEAAYAPGTGGLTIGGLDGAELLDTIELLAALPIVAADLVEVAPRYDPTGRTPLMAAHLLFELVYRDRR